jgi:hypothetical protein
MSEGMTSPTRRTTIEAPQWLFEAPGPPKWEDTDVTLENNLYWKTTGPVTFKDKSLEDWERTSGKDAGSLVADPLFVDPDKGDFELLADSPATDVGFVVFDYAQAGVYEWDDVERRLG